MIIYTAPLLLSSSEAQEEPSMASPASFLLLCFTFLSISFNQSTACFSSLISFGGSPSDNGNLLLALKAGDYWDHYVGHWPYGENFFHHPTGRFCDGRIVLDFIAEALKLPYPPPHLAGPGNHSFHKGVNLAIAGDTLAETSFFVDRGYPLTVYSFSFKEEVQWFRELLPHYCSDVSNCTEKLGNAAFVVGTYGRNDITIEMLHGTGQDEIRSVVVPVMIEGYVAGLKELIEIGARTIIVPNSYPQGCIPGTVGYFPAEDGEYDEKTGCLAWLNEVTELFNNRLSAELQVLRTQYPHVTILYFDFYGLTIDMILSPHHYGFELPPLYDCCGGGGPYNYNRSLMCGMEGANVCDDPSKALFWDGVHTTEAANKVFVDVLMQEFFALPSVKQQCADIKRLNYEAVSM